MAFKFYRIPLLQNIFPAAVSTLPGNAVLHLPSPISLQKDGMNILKRVNIESHARRQHKAFRFEDAEP